MAAYIVFMRDRMKDPVEFEKYMAAVPGTLEGHPVRPLAIYGKLEQLGSAEDLYKRPVSRFVATFIGKCNLLEGRVTEPGRFQLAGSGIMYSRPALSRTVMTMSQAIEMRTPESPGLGGTSCIAFEGKISTSPCLGSR